MMMVYSAALTGIAVAAVALYGLLRWVFYEPLRRATEEHIIHTAKQQSHFLETVRGVQSIKLFGRQEERRSRWLNLVVDGVNQDLVTQKLGLGFRCANGLVFGIERVAVVWLGALLVLDSAFSVGMLFAFVAYKDQFSARVAGLVDKVIELRMLNLQGERLADIVPRYLDSVPRAKCCCLRNDFSYYASAGGHTLGWYIVPPFGRRVYCPSH